MVAVLVGPGQISTGKVAQSRWLILTCQLISRGYKRRLEGQIVGVPGENNAVG